MRRGPPRIFAALLGAMTLTPGAARRASPGQPPRIVMPRTGCASSPEFAGLPGLGLLLGLVLLLVRTHRKRRPGLASRTRVLAVVAMLLCVGCPPPATEPPTRRAAPPTRPAPDHRARPAKPAGCFHARENPMYIRVSLCLQPPKAKTGRFTYEEVQTVPDATLRKYCRGRYVRSSAGITLQVQQCAHRNWSHLSSKGNAQPWRSAPGVIPVKIDAKGAMTVTTRFGAPVQLVPRN
jgi:hypothetical protein